MSAKPIPDGFRTLTPCLFGNDAPKLIDFLKAAFDGVVTFRIDRPDGSLMHAEMRVGDSMLMVDEATEPFGPMPASIYMYVTDCDTVYEKALKAGGESVFPMMTLPSGQRYGGVKDPSGNIWWVATQVEEVTPEEESRRWQNFKMP